jgi:hypothetical protein
MTLALSSGGPGGGIIREAAAHRIGLVRVQVLPVAEERGAIGADHLVAGPHVEEHMRMIKRRQRADAHEFLGTDVNDAVAGIVVEMGRGVGCHDVRPRRAADWCRDGGGLAAGAGWGNWPQLNTHPCAVMDWSVLSCVSAKVMEPLA